MGNQDSIPSPQVDPVADPEMNYPAQPQAEPVADPEMNYPAQPQTEQDS